MTNHSFIYGPHTVCTMSVNIRGGSASFHQLYVDLDMGRHSVLPTVRRDELSLWQFFVHRCYWPVTRHYSMRVIFKRHSRASRTCPFVRKSESARWLFAHDTSTDGTNGVTTRVWRRTVLR